MTRLRWLPSGLVVSGTVTADGVLAADFERAAGSFNRGRPEAAMVALLPLELDEDQFDRRVREMLRVAALLTGALPPGSLKPERAEVIALADELVAHGARCDAGAVGSVISAYRSGTTGRTDLLLVDVLVELLTRYAAGSAR